MSKGAMNAVLGVKTQVFFSIVSVPKAGKPKEEIAVSKEYERAEDYCLNGDWNEKFPHVNAVQIEVVFAREGYAHYQPHEASILRIGDAPGKITDQDGKPF